jgi:NAD(P)-dependent dehydrogenase (short-subunit alcohol dehydrogenase family)
MYCGHRRSSAVTTVLAPGGYKVSKHAVVSLSETLHHELAERGAKVKVSVLCPGVVRTRIMESASATTFGRGRWNARAVKATLHRADHCRLSRPP